MKFLQELIETTRMLANHVDVKEFCVAGSALYHAEPKDLDFLVLVDATNFTQAARWVFGSAWDLCGGEYDTQDDTWGALRNGNVNLIVAVDPGWYTRAKLANEVCHALRLQNKDDRVTVYRVVRDGVTADALRQAGAPF